MARRAFFLSSVRADQGHRLVVGGGNFFTRGGPEQKFLGAAVLQACQRMDYDAVSLGSEDFSFGSEILVASLRGLPLVSTNMRWSNGDKMGQPMIVKEYEGLPLQGRVHDKFKVAVLAFMDEHMQGPIDVLLMQDSRKVKIEPMVESARNWVARAHKSAEMVVALVQCNTIDAAAFIRQVPGIDVVVACRTLEEVTTEPLHEDATVIVANGDRGRFIGELRFDFSSLANPEGRAVLLDQRIPEDPAMKTFIHHAEENIDEQLPDSLAQAPPSPGPPNSSRARAHTPAAAPNSAPAAAPLPAPIKTSAPGVP